MLWIVTDSATQKNLFNLVAGEAVILLRPHGNKLYDGTIEWPEDTLSDGRVFDRIEPAFERYVVGGKRDSAYEIWTFRYRTRRVPVGRTLRLILQTSATVHWTTNQWANIGKGDTAVAALGDLHFFDLPTAELPAGAHTEWTFFWPAANRWEGGENFRVEIV